MQLIIKNQLDELKRLCREFDVKNLYLFGSATQNKFNEDSDIDLLISFKDNLSIKQYTDNYFSFYYELTELFKRDIDLITESALSNPFFIESIDKTKELIYEA